MSEVHNHITRDINPVGECPACDLYHAKHCPEIYLFEIKSLKARLLEYEGRTYSENEEIKKLKAENKKLQNAIDENCNENPYDFSQYCQQLQYNYDLEITKLTRERDTLKKCAEFYADKNNWHNINGLHDTSRAIIDEGDWSDIKEPSDYYHIRATGGKTARKALQDVEESENEKA